MKGLTTTLNKLSEHYKNLPYTWENMLRLLGKTEADDETLSLETILESIDLEEATRALRAVGGHDGALNVYALQCARLVLPIFEKQYPNDNRPRQAIETAELFAVSMATVGELEAAREAVRLAYISASRSVAWFFHEAVRDAAKNVWEAITKPVASEDEWDNAYKAWAVADYAADSINAISVATTAAMDAALAALNASYAFSSRTAEKASYAACSAWRVGNAAERFYDLRDDLKHEFINLCRLEGVYGVVAAREQGEQQ